MRVQAEHSILIAQYDIFTYPFALINGSLATEVALNFSQKKIWKYKSTQNKKKNALFLWSLYYKFYSLIFLFLYVSEFLNGSSQLDVLSAFDQA